ncbi:hypothetical protein NHX12_034509 [Muraenolepis orangiensis]|uniref:Major facilitator superfamily domain-containing protein 2B n=1 Tax=Muraenolepis orangiensis TaxID=630683 RepID=A0A9Q0D734_9TELE|nr:hypothetical protein NHX12_034509 [Muraenolepis orangiensis]
MKHGEGLRIGEESNRRVGVMSLRLVISKTWRLESLPGRHLCTPPIPMVTLDHALPVTSHLVGRRPETGAEIQPMASLRHQRRPGLCVPLPEELPIVLTTPLPSRELRDGALSLQEADLAHTVIVQKPLNRGPLWKKKAVMSHNHLETRGWELVGSPDSQRRGGGSWWVHLTPRDEGVGAGGFTQRRGETRRWELVGYLTPRDEGVGAETRGWELVGYLTPRERGWELVGSPDSQRRGGGSWWVHLTPRDEGVGAGPLGGPMAAEISGRAVTVEGAEPLYHDHTPFHPQPHPHHDNPAAPGPVLAPSHKLGLRLTHSLSAAMTKRDKSAPGHLGKLTRASDPLFTKKPHQIDPSQRLSLCSKLCFAIGGAPKEVAASATAFFLQIYLLDVAQITPVQASMITPVQASMITPITPVQASMITPVQASMVLFIGKAWGAVTDPLVGFFITKSRWTKIGRLMPWMVGCTPFVVVSYFYLWYVPPFTQGRFLWYLGFYCLYQTLITCFHVPYSALTMFLSIDQKERDSATAYRMTLEILGTLVGAAIQGQIVASAHLRKHCLDPGNGTAGPLGNGTAGPLGNGSGAEIVKSEVHSQDFLSHSKEVYMIAAGVVGAVFLVYPYTAKTEKPTSFHQGFILVMRHGPYLTLTAAFLFVTVAIQLVQSNFVLFCTYAVDLKDHFQNIVLTILVSAVLSTPMWQWFLQRFGKKTAAFCGISWIMPFTLMLVFIPNVTVAYVVAVASGLSVAASLLLPWSMLPDVVDDFRLANPSCKGHEAIFYSFYVFFTKFASGVSLGVSTLCLQ